MSETMSETVNTENNPISPTEINLHQKSRILEITYSDGFRFNYPCEYLRVFSSAPELAKEKIPVYGKAKVNIERIEAKGTDALHLYFDDDHDTGIYSWETLYKLGKNYDENWSGYLKNINLHNLSRTTDGESLDVERTIKILYFIKLALIAGKDSETVTLPESVENVETMLVWLRARGERWESEFGDQQVQVTVNKQFAELYTILEQGDEVALVPKHIN